MRGRRRVVRVKPGSPDSLRGIRMPQVPTPPTPTTRSARSDHSCRQRSSAWVGSTTSGGNSLGPLEWFSTGLRERAPPLHRVERGGCCRSFPQDLEVTVLHRSSGSTIDPMGATSAPSTECTLVCPAGLRLVPSCERGRQTCFRARRTTTSLHRVHGGVQGRTSRAKAQRSVAWKPLGHGAETLRESRWEWSRTDETGVGRSRCRSSES